ncbi:MAG: GNAT family N-acetyltransferase [Candidatus Cloacimonetes bacterium]|nr:GNAT family N-acetyltransferase [Candidatus Cloacimonadota bacterium]
MISIIRSTTLDEQLFSELCTLWQETGIANAARADSLESIRHTLNNGAFLILAFEDDNLLGSAWLTHDFRRIYVHHMAVTPNRQNQGIGRQILLEAASVSRELKLQLKLEVHEHNPSARKLYDSFGFVELIGYRTMVRRSID